MNSILKVAALPCCITASSANVLAVTIEDCDVSASVSFPAGEMFDGTFSDHTQTDTSGSEVIAWSHDAPGVSFVVSELGGPDQVVCRLNGLVTGNVESTGTGILNGVPGYDFRIEIVDNRPAPDTVLLVASISYYPTQRIEGTVGFATAKTIVIPVEIATTAGGSSGGYARLFLNDTIHCKYVGAGSSYVFDKCSDPLASGYMAGDSIAINSALLRIQHADRSFPTTSARVDLGSGPAPGDPDFYRLAVWNSSGTEVYHFAENVVFGDIAITLLGYSSAP